MSFCTNCGKKIETPSSFCPECGFALTESAIQQQPVVVVSEATLRQSSLSEANRLVEHFSQKEEEYDTLMEFMDSAESEPFSKKKYVVWGYVSIWVGLLCLASGGAGGILFMLGLAGLGAFLIIQGNRKAKEWKSIAEWRDEQIDILQDELAEWYQAYGECPVGITYTHPAILIKIRDMIYNGRANSIKEAINEMIRDRHLSAVEASAMQAAESANAAATMSFISILLR